MIKENQRYISRFIALFDCICIMLSFLLSYFIRFQSGLLKVQGERLTFQGYLKPMIIIVPIYLLIYNVFNLYEPYRIKSIFEEAVNIVKANLLSFLIFILFLYIFKTTDYSRQLLLIFAAMCSIVTIAERGVIRGFLRRIRRKGLNLKHILFVGCCELTEEFLLRLEKNRHWGFNPVGILDDKKKKGDTLKKVEIIGSIDTLEQKLENSDIDEVFITLPIEEYSKLPQVINACEKSGVRTQVIPGYYKYIPAKPHLEEVEGLPIINIRYIPLDKIVNKYAKRFVDIIGATTAIILFSPFMLVAYVGIKITSPGPVIFKQERVGLNKKNFVMYKFRSMKLQKDSEEKVKWTTENDPRKTKFGSFLRKTSIDELPQIFNVLKGDMSLVGPRPERPFFVEKFKEEIPKYMIKHQVRPGMTGWAQVHGFRGDTSIVKRIEHDIYYIENWSLGMDFKIMWMTVFKGFVNKNAY